MFFHLRHLEDVCGPPELMKYSASRLSVQLERPVRGHLNGRTDLGRTANGALLARGQI